MKKPTKPKAPPVYDRIREILTSARANVARSVNSTQVVANWLIGREIVEDEQGGQKRAGYGEKLIPELSELLTRDFGRGYTTNNLEYFRKFYLTYPELMSGTISHAVRGKSSKASKVAGKSSLISDAVPRKFDNAAISDAVRGKLTLKEEIRIRNADLRELITGAFAGIYSAASRETPKPGRLNPDLSWTHYRTLLKVEKGEVRPFYEIEAVTNNWTYRELERQIASLLYERLVQSRDKKGVMRLAKKGQQVLKPEDVFKDPMVIEFVGLPESPKLVESELESALVEGMKNFLLELGKGFAFVGRQQRLTLEGDHFYIDLVFYHMILKCYVLIELKTGKLTHEDLGQLQMYVHYYDREKRTEGDQPTLGLIL